MTALDSTTRIPHNSAPDGEHGPQARLHTPAKSDGGADPREASDDGASHLTTDANARYLLNLYERRSQPNRPPWKAVDDPTYREWVALLVRYPKPVCKRAFTIYVEGQDGKWPNYLQMERALNRISRDLTSSDRDCHKCDGGGWQPAMRTERAQSPITGQWHDIDVPDTLANGYTYAYPCNCRAGNVAERTETWREATNAQR